MSIVKASSDCVSGTGSGGNRPLIREKNELLGYEQHIVSLCFMICSKYWLYLSFAACHSAFCHLLLEDHDHRQVQYILALLDDCQLPFRITFLPVLS